YGDFALQYGQSAASHFLHNHGTLQALERLLGLLHPEGFLLVNDYGQTEVSRGDDFEHQLFAEATAGGLNFPLLKAYFAGGGRCQWAESRSRASAKRSIDQEGVASWQPRSLSREAGRRPSPARQPRAARWPSGLPPAWCRSSWPVPASSIHT